MYETHKRNHDRGSLPDGTQLLRMYRSWHLLYVPEGVQEYEDLRTYVKETDEDDHTEGTDGSDGKQTVVDFKALKKINPDDRCMDPDPGYQH